MQKFLEFIDRKARQARKQLKIVKKLLESQGMKVVAFLDEDDPYLFLHNPNKNLTFEGVRIYKIGSSMAFRIQKEEHTHPFGQAYGLDVEEMFNDLLSDHHKPEDAGKEVIKCVMEEMKRFFDQSAKAEKDLRSNEFDPNDPFGKVVVKSTGLDYSSMVMQ